MLKSPFITEAEAIKEDFKGRTNYWLCRPEITNAKDLQICRAVLPAGEGDGPFAGEALRVERTFAGDHLVCGGDAGLQTDQSS